MGLLCLLMLVGADEPIDDLGKKMLPIYVKEAAEYSLAVDSAPKKELVLNPTLPGL